MARGIWTTSDRYCAALGRRTQKKSVIFIAEGGLAFDFAQTPAEPGSEMSLVSYLTLCLRKLNSFQKPIHRLLALGAMPDPRPKGCLVAQ